GTDRRRGNAVPCPRRSVCLRQPAPRHAPASERARHRGHFRRHRSRLNYSLSHQHASTRDHCLMKHTVRLLTLVLLLILPGLAVAQPLPIPEPPTLNATSYILIDATSGQVLAASNANKPVEPASITKLMTEYIAFDAIKQGTMALDDKVRISKKAWKMGGSRMFVEVGDVVSVEMLLH